MSHEGFLLAKVRTFDLTDVEDVTEMFRQTFASFLDLDRAEQVAYMRHFMSDERFEGAFSVQQALHHCEDPVIKMGLCLLASLCTWQKDAEFLRRDVDA